MLWAVVKSERRLAPGVGMAPQVELARMVERSAMLDAASGNRPWPATAATEHSRASTAGAQSVWRGMAVVRGIAASHGANGAGRGRRASVLPCSCQGGARMRSWGGGGGSFGCCKAE